MVWLEVRCIADVDRWLSLQRRANIGDLNSGSYRGYAGLTVQKNAFSARERR